MKRSTIIVSSLKYTLDMTDVFTDERDLDVLVVGAGFSGVHLLHQLRQAGLSAVLVEAGSSPGGIWHWNCYPGARVDSHVPMYEYSDRDVWDDWYWDERFPDWRALRRYFDHVIDRWDLRDAMRFDTRVTGGHFEESDARWSIELSRGAALRARHIVFCTGFAAKPHVPELPGIAAFRGDRHHTAQWPQSGVDLEGRRVGVIGTGASGVQVIQEAAGTAEHLTVFQRTPILALPMQQRSMGRDLQDEAKREYPARFAARRLTNSGFDFPERGGAFDVDEHDRQSIFEELWAAGGLSFWAGNFSDVLIDERANREAYDFWRDKVRARIDDPAIAELLAPTEPPHPFGVKRPSLEQSYYEVFNRDDVTLVDLRADPIEEVEPSGIRTATGHHDLDLIVFATGFDAVTGGLAAIDVRGTGGETLAQHWQEGVRTHLGVACHGFPNLFFLYGPQSPSGFCNGPTCAEVQSEWLTDLLVSLRDGGHARIEAKIDAETAWREQVEFIASLSLFPRADSWYMGANVPGKRREMLNWPGGLQLYLERCREEAQKGYPGFDLGGPVADTGAGSSS